MTLSHPSPPRLARRAAHVATNSLVKRAARSGCASSSIARSSCATSIERFFLGTHCFDLSKGPVSRRAPLQPAVARRAKRSCVFNGSVRSSFAPSSTARSGRASSLNHTRGHAPLRSSLGPVAARRAPAPAKPARPRTSQPLCDLREAPSSPAIDEQPRRYKLAQSCCEQPRSGAWLEPTPFLITSNPYD